ncbi:MAG: alpha/beta hydrolase [Myxococcales bacterium]|nr:alpha/beta hydrolase [Myxococcales bacterium]
MDSTPVTIASADGLTLRGEAWGDPAGPPVVFLHGGGQTRHAWGATADRVARSGSYVLAMDHRGHGDSDWPPAGDLGVGFDLSTFAGDVRAIAAWIGRPPAVVGASLGGLAALMAEGELGPLLRALVLVDVAPRMEQEGVMRVISFMNSGLDGFASLDEAADAIAAYLPHRKRPRDTAGLAKNLRHGSDGRWRWHWDPRFVRRDQGDPSFQRARLEAAARSLTIPTLVVRGRMSDVLSDEGVAELRAMVPHAEYADVAGASHMVAGDDNDAFSAGVIEFLARVDAKVKHVLVRA